MGKKSKRRGHSTQRKAKNSKQTYEAIGEVPEGTKKCSHLTKAVRVGVLQNQIPHMKLGHCSVAAMAPHASIASARGQATGFDKDFCFGRGNVLYFANNSLIMVSEKKILSCSETLGKEIGICVCLKCGNQGCDRYSEDRHGLSHYQCMSSHTVTVHLHSLMVWCYSCDVEIAVVPNTDLHECITLLIKTLKLEGQPNDHILVPKIVLTDVTREEKIMTKHYHSTGRLKGLVNLGNTCFFNAVMQNLCQTELLHVAMACVNQQEYCHTISAWNNHLPQLPVKVTTPPGSLAAALGRLLNDMKNPCPGPLSPQQLFAEICKKAPRFRGFQQQDSQELLRYLLDSLKTEQLRRIKIGLLNAFGVKAEDGGCMKALPEAKKNEIREYVQKVSTTVVDSVFAGQLDSIVVCRECHKESRVTEAFLDLSLSLAAVQHTKAAKANYKDNTPKPSTNRESQKPSEKRQKSTVEEDDSCEAKQLSKHQQKAAREAKRKKGKKGKGRQRKDSGSRAEADRNQAKEEEDARSDAEIDIMAVLDVDEGDTTETKRDDVKVASKEIVQDGNSEVNRENELENMNVSDVDEGDTTETKRDDVKVASKEIVQDGNSEVNRENELDNMNVSDTEDDIAEKIDEETLSERRIQDFINLGEATSMVDIIEESDETEMETLGRGENIHPRTCDDTSNEVTTSVAMQATEHRDNVPRATVLESNTYCNPDLESHCKSETITGEIRIENNEETSEDSSTCTEKNYIVEKEIILTDGLKQDLSCKRSCDTQRSSTETEYESHHAIGNDPQPITDSCLRAEIIKSSNSSSSVCSVEPNTKESDVESSSAGVQDVACSEEITSNVNKITLGEDDSDSVISSEGSHQVGSVSSSPMKNSTEGVPSAGDEQSSDIACDICRLSFGEKENGHVTLAVVEKCEENLTLNSESLTQDRLTKGNIDASATCISNRGHTLEETSCSSTEKGADGEIIIGIDEDVADVDDRIHSTNFTRSSASSEEKQNSCYSLCSDNLPKSEKSPLNQSDIENLDKERAPYENQDKAAHLSVLGEEQTMMNQDLKSSEPGDGKSVAGRGNSILKSSSLEMLTLNPPYHPSHAECSLQSCLSVFCSPEILEGKNKFACEECTKKSLINDGMLSLETLSPNEEASEEENSSADEENHPEGTKPPQSKLKEIASSVSTRRVVYTEATKQLLLSYTPPVLTLHLKRFQQVGFGLRKLPKHVDFPLVLDLSPFCSRRGKNLPDMNGQVLYSLIGVVEHSGGLNSGHYTAYVKVKNKPTHCLHEKISTINDLNAFIEEMWTKNQQSTQGLQHQHGEPSEGQWFYVSDSHSTMVPESRVKKSQAYMLFYERLPLRITNA